MFDCHNYGPRAGVSVLIPARNEAKTIVSVLQSLPQEVDQVIVAGGRSDDETDELADRCGATVVDTTGAVGKGGAVAAALPAVSNDVVVLLDADLEGVHAGYVWGLAGPLFASEELALVKGAFHFGTVDQIDGTQQTIGGGRVTELVARPLLKRFFPELATLSRPLSGQLAVRTSLLRSLHLEDGYRLEVAMLIDVWQRYGRKGIAEVDLGLLQHRHRPIAELAFAAEDVIDAVFERVAF